MAIGLGSRWRWLNVMLGLFISNGMTVGSPHEEIERSLRNATAEASASGGDNWSDVDDMIPVATELAVPQLQIDFTGRNRVADAAPDGRTGITPLQMRELGPILTPSGYFVAYQLSGRIVGESLPATLRVAQIVRSIGNDTHGRLIKRTREHLDDVQSSGTEVLGWDAPGATTNGPPAGQDLELVIFGASWVENLSSSRVSPVVYWRIYIRNDSWLASPVLGGRQIEFDQYFELVRLFDPQAHDRVVVGGAGR